MKDSSTQSPIIRRSNNINKKPLLQHNIVNSPQGEDNTHITARPKGAVNQYIQDPVTEAGGEAGSDGLTLPVSINSPGNCERIALSVNCQRNSPITVACRADVVVQGVIIDAIIDTGAVRTMISSKIYEKLKNLLGVMEVTDISLNSASGNRCTILGEVQLNFALRGKNYSQKAVVAEMGHIELPWEWTSSMDVGPLLI